MHHQIVSCDEWLVARRALLAREKEATRLRHQINAVRIALPWVRLAQRYVFETPYGPRSVAGLFAGRTGSSRSTS